MKKGFITKMLGLSLLAAGAGAGITGTRIFTENKPAGKGVAEATTTRQYRAGMREGLIGATAEVPLDNPADNVFHVALREPLNGSERVWLVYELAGVADHTAVSRSVNDRLAVGGYLVRNRKGWAPQREQLAASWLRAGDNVIRFTLPKGAQHSYRVRNLALEVEKGPATAGAAAPQLVVNQPEGHPYYQDRAYVKGFVSAPGNGAVRVFVDGSEARVSGGEFEALVRRGPSQASAAWKATVEARYADGRTVSRDVDFAAAGTATYAYPLEQSGRAARKQFAPDRSTAIALPGTSLTAAPGALRAATAISVTALREVDIPALDAGMVNVTKHGAGFRYLPHGTRFRKDVNLKVAYDEKAIPAGYTEQDIKTYFFDEQTHHWVALPTDTVLAGEGAVVSRTTHFTDMINAILKVPESPEVAANQSNSIKGIQAANPAAAVSLLAPPTVSNNGSAEMDYGLELPAGRNGMEPQLSVRYSSGGGNGWMGLDWDLQLPSLTIDTRWGAPRYDTLKETETYLLNGAQLSPVAHRAAPVNRTDRKRFHPRVEGEFARIIRHGDNPGHYWWEVTDKRGIKHLYGGREGKQDTSAVLRTDEAHRRGNVAYWALVESRDPDGNFVRYHYRKQQDVGLAKGTVPGYQLYIDKITYTGHGEQEGKYTVRFTRDRDAGSPWTRRNDVSIRANLGFKQVTADLLKKVEVQYDGQPVRRYEFYYREGEFHKTLLDSLSEFDAKGNLFNTHKFEYYNDIKAVAGRKAFFAPVPKWETPFDNIRGGFLNPIDAFGDEASVLSGTKSADFSVGMAVTVGFDPNVATKSFSVGGNLNYSQSTSEGLLSMIDINGDGLPDKVFVRGDGISYRANLSKPGGEPAFDKNLRSVEGIRAFHKEKSKTVSGGLEAHGPMPLTVYAGFSGSTTTSTTSVYFAEVNGDGLTDVVVNGKVYFNHRKPDGTVRFTLNSSDTPSPISQTGAVDGNILPEDPKEREKAIDENPLHDVVRMWRAPYDGQVEVTAPVQLIESTDTTRPETPADGVRVAIQHKGTELWSATLAADDYREYTPTGVSSLTVRQGDRLYFRVQSVANGSFDQVRWAPVIRYLNRDAHLRDANGKRPYHFSVAEDYLLSARQEVSAPINGRVKIEGTFKKPVTTDDVEVLIVKRIQVGLLRVDSVAARRQYAWHEVVNEPITLDNDVRADDIYRFRVNTGSNVDWRAIGWTPRIYYTASYDRSYPDVYDKEGKPMIDMYSVPQLSVYPRLVQESKAWAVPDGFDTLHLSPRLSFGSPFQSGKVTFTVKKRDILLFKQTLTVQSWAAAGGPFKLPVTPGDSLFFEFHVGDQALARNLGNGQVTFPAKDTTLTVAAGVHAVFDEETNEDVIFGPLYRGWGHFAYNGNRDRAGRPINEGELKLSEEMKNAEDGYRDPKENPDGSGMQGGGTYDPRKEVFMVLVPLARERLWTGADKYTYLGEAVISSSRLGDDDLGAIQASPGGGAQAVNRISKSGGTSFSLGGSYGGLGGSYGQSSGDSKVVLDYMDMNGDQYPDIVTDQRIQYTTATGGLTEKAVMHPFGPGHVTATDSKGVTLSGSFALSDYEGKPADAKKVTVSVGSGQSSAGLNGNYSEGTNRAGVSYNDLNGDGLPDRVRSNGHVALNLGYGFAPEEDWGHEAIQAGDSRSYGAGLGVSFVNGSISAGVGVSRSDNFTRKSLQDVNGDGLTDQLAVGVRGANDDSLWVRLNQGNGFAPAILWATGVRPGQSSSASESLNAAFTAGIYIPIVNIKICFNPSTSVARGMSRELTRLGDVNGDGYPDHLVSRTDSGLTVLASAIGRTNLLKGVKRPLGASFALDYQRHGNTYEMPSDLWALSQLVVRDGLKGDGVDSLLTTFTYEDPFFDRHEREFYGFGKVTTRIHDAGQADPNKFYRSIEQVFHNRDYFHKGLLQKEIMRDGEGKKYSEKENEYTLKPVVAGTVFFPALETASQYFYEGQPNAGKRTRMRFGYDTYGNVTSLSDEGDLDDRDDDLQATVAYHRLEESHIVEVPKSIVVVANGKTYRKRESDIDDKGRVEYLRQYLDNDRVARYDMAYDDYGNLKKLTRPANHDGKRFDISYSYDPYVHTYVVKVTDKHNYTSEATYDYRFGQMLTSTDANNQVTQYALDAIGRVEQVTGPYEKESGAPYTIRFEYHPGAEVPWALTRHYDPANPGNDLLTATFVDGLGRVVQTKKDQALYVGENALDKEGMSVSGRVRYDGLGRPTHAYYPTFENAGTPGTFNPGFDAVQPTVTTYDVLDRALRVTLPDGAATETVYGFASDRQGAQQFSTRTTDANGKVSEAFADAQGRLTATKKYTAKGDVWTSFTYNPMGEQTGATDDKGHTIASVYDWLGQRLSRIHPDAGLTTYTYDPAGNLTGLQTANLRGSSDTITYAYDYERLRKVTYPQHPENNVTYKYGEKDAPHHRAGRVTLQQDASGAQEFFYGPLGEVVKNIRTVVIPQHDAQTYTTEWQYDTWNRLTSLTYPDGEVVSYAYNAGGQLRSMSGTKGGRNYHYVKQLGYDKFGQRVFLAYGNGTKTTYDYEPERRRLHQMTARTAAKRVMMSNVYDYDKLNNLLSLKNNAPVPPSSLMGGPSEYGYQYDDLYRLTEASGAFRGAREQHRYALSMQYNSVGSITRKNQKHERAGGGGTSWVEQKETTYQQAYDYSDEQPHAPVHIGKQTYTYDANGNQTGWTHDVSGQRRKLFWDEDNRIRAIMDNGAAYHYVYDAQGERVLKGHSSGQSLYLNASRKGGSGNVGNYTVYVNPYLVLRSGSYTKHYYVESQRIVSKLGSGWDNNGKGPLEAPKAGVDSVNYAAKTQQLSEGILKNLKYLGVDGAVITAGKSNKIPPGQLDGTPGTGTAENFQYYFHPDHLGSTSYVTDVSGEVYQHLEYFAFGETFVEEHSNTHRTPYLFNGKERDEETGLYYYGARYYDPKASIWQSVDPLAEEYPGWSPYNYTLNNPVVYTDPDGKIVFVPIILGAWAVAEVAMNAYDAYETAKTVMDPNATRAEKTVAVAGFGIGLIAPGGGYGTVARKGMKAAGEIGTELVQHADDGAKLLKRAPCGCFTAGTLVLTEQGHKQIEQVREGDKVWAFDDKTGKLALKRVTDTFTYERDSVYTIYVGSEAIEATSDHPFFIGGKWLKVHQLRKGQWVQLYSGEKARIDSIAIVAKRTRVYNFTVEDFHTYYVSARDVLVHNSGPCDLSDAGKLVQANKKAGDAREAAELKELKETFPDATVLGQKTLRTKDGKKAIDPLTGEGRRTDFVVIGKDDQVKKVVETTSQRANKGAQLAKEGRIRANGGTYIRHKGKLYNIDKIKTTLSRRD